MLALLADPDNMLYTQAAPVWNKENAGCILIRWPDVNQCVFNKNINLQNVFCENLKWLWKILHYVYISILIDPLYIITLSKIQN